MSRSTRKPCRQGRRRSLRGGSTLTDLAVPAMLLYASNTVGRGKRYFAAKTPYYSRNRRTRRR